MQGDQRATVVEVGAGLREYVAGGRPVVEGYAEQESAHGSRGEVLAPWPNRIGDGRYRVDGAEHQLPVNEPARGNAIHGLVRFVPWECTSQSTERVVLRHVVHHQAGWPFTVAVVATYELGDDGLRVTTTATNLGATAAPWAVGHHPYLSPGDGPLDDCTLEVPASAVLLTDDRGLPTGEQPVDGGPYDLRTPGPIGDRHLDTAFTDLDRDVDGRAWVRLRRPDGTGAALWLGEGHRWLMLYTGDGLPEADRRRTGLAVEPMTAPPDAFRSGTDLVRLEPGQSSTADWGLCPLP